MPQTMILKPVGHVVSPAENMVDENWGSVTKESPRPGLRNGWTNSCKGIFDPIRTKDGV